jgi:uncharacterized membrane protein
MFPPTLFQDHLFHETGLVWMTSLSRVQIGGLALMLLAGALLPLTGLWGDRRRRMLLITLLRVLAAVWIFVLILEPAREWRQIRRLPARVLIAVDTSRSMSLPSSVPDMTRAAQVRQVLQQEGLLEGKGLMPEFFTFDSEVRPLSHSFAWSELQVNGQRTDIWHMLRALAAREGLYPAAALVLISDGRDTGALSTGLSRHSDTDAEAWLQKELAFLDIPVHTIQAGGEGLSDLAIERIAGDRFAFVHNSLQIEVHVRASGLSPQVIPVSLYGQGDELLASELMEVGGSSLTQTVVLTLTPDQVGRQVYQVRVPRLENEAITWNNEQAFVLNVARDRIRVLFLCGQPDYEQSFLRRHFRKHPSVDLVSFYILRTANDRAMAPDSDLSLIQFPVRQLFEEKLHTFDLVAFVNFDYRPYNMAIYLRTIADYVREGGAFLMIGGQRSFSLGDYAGTYIEDMLPVELPAVGSEPLWIGEPFRPRLTGQGLRHPVMAMDAHPDQNRFLWEQLPALRGMNRLGNPRSGALVLLEHPVQTLDNGKPMPLLALHAYHKGRTAVLAADSTWRWGFFPPGTGAGESHYDEFYGNLIRWLIQDPVWSPLQLHVDGGDVHIPGQPVSVQMRALDETYHPLEGASYQWELVHMRAKQNAVLRSGEGQVRADGRATLIFSDLEQGSYRVVVRAGSVSSGTRQEKETVFVVQEMDYEMADTTPNPELLRAISRMSGGQHLPLSADVFDRLAWPKPVHEQLVRFKREPLWNTWLMLAGVFFLLFTEWTLRRRWGRM